jgi:hypothetical protein
MSEKVVKQTVNIKVVEYDDGTYRAEILDSSVNLPKTISDMDSVNNDFVSDEKKTNPVVSGLIANKRKNMLNNLPNTSLNIGKNIPLSESIQQAKSRLNKTGIDLTKGGKTYRRKIIQKKRKTIRHKK